MQTVLKEKKTNLKQKVESCVPKGNNILIQAGWLSWKKMHHPAF